jgi:2,3-dihydro-2,3-dihydroxybenzoate dehydrogenase
MENALQNTVALITGAAHGMGESIARIFAAQGAAVALIDRQYDALHEVSSELQTSGSRVQSHTLDVRNRTQIETAIDEIETNLGPIDIVVNSAGLGIYKAIGELTEEDWDTTFDVNVKGTFLVCKAVATGMIARRKGLIINIASLAAKIKGFERGTCYTSSKYAVDGFSRCLGVELQPHGVRVCCLNPGPTDTHFRGEPSGNPNMMQATDVAEAALYVATQRPGIAVREVVFSMINESW